MGHAGYYWCIYSNQFTLLIPTLLNVADHFQKIFLISGGYGWVFETPVKPRYLYRLISLRKFMAAFLAAAAKSPSGLAYMILREELMIIPAPL